MKKSAILLLALAVALPFAGCSKSDESNESSTAASSKEKNTINCAIGYPVLLEDGRIQPTSGMKEYADIVTMKDFLTKYLNQTAPVTFDSQGNIASIGGMRAENGNKFIIIHSTSPGRFTQLEQTPEEIVLTDFGSYEIMYVDAEGIQVSILE